MNTYDDIYTAHIEEEEDSNKIFLILKMMDMIKILKEHALINQLLFM